MRRLNDQIDMQNLEPALQKRIRTDISALERMKSVGLRPWGLTDFDLRVFTFLKENILGSRWYFLTRKLLGSQQVAKAKEEYSNEHQHEMRILAQKIVVSYMQERENIRDQIQTQSEFSPALANVHRRARRYLNPTFSVLKQFKITGFIAAASSLAFAQYMGLLEVSADYLQQNLKPALEFLPGAQTAADYLGTALHSLGTSYRAVADPISSGVHWFTGKIWNGASYTLSPVWDALTFGNDAVGKSISAFAQSAVQGMQAFGGTLVSSGAWFFGHIGSGLSWVWSHITAAFAAGWHYTTQPFVTVAHWIGPTVVESAPYAAAAAGAGLVIYFTVQNRQAVGGFLARSGRGVASWTGRQAVRLKNFTVATMAHRTLLRYLKSVQQQGATYQELLILVSDFFALFDTVVWNPKDRRQVVLQSNDTQRLNGLAVRTANYWTFYAGFLDSLTEQLRRGDFSKDEVAVLAQRLSHRIAGFSKRAEMRIENSDWEAQAGLSPEIQRRIAVLYLVLKDRLGRTDEMDTEISQFWLQPGQERLETMPTIYTLGRFFYEVADLKDNYSLTQTLALSRFAMTQLGNFDVARLIIEMHFNRFLEDVMTQLSEKDIQESFETLDHLRFRTSLLYSQYVTNPSDPLFQIRKHDGWKRLPWLLRRAQKHLIREGQENIAVAMETRIAAFRRGHIWASLLEVFGRAHLFPKRWMRKLIEDVFDAEESVTDIAHELDQNFVANGGNLSILRTMLFKYVIDRPQLIRAPQDVTVLLDRLYFWPAFSHQDHAGELEQALVKVVRQKVQLYPRVWSYDPSSTEVLHGLIIQRMKDLHFYPTSYTELKVLWTRLTERGVSSHSDRILEELIQIAPQTDIEHLKTLAIAEGRIWETDLNSRLAIAQIRATPEYAQLMESRDGNLRRYILKNLIINLQKLLPERGISYVTFLEQLSVDMMSSFEEAQMIEMAKLEVVNRSPGEPTARPAPTMTSDSNLTGIKAIYEKVKNWPKRDQFNFILFVRGEAKPSKRLSNAFQRVSVERVRRMYEILPLGARVGILDTFFTHSLVTPDAAGLRWTRRLVDHIIGGQETEAQKISHQLLTAFLHAVNDVGNGNLTTTILSYLYALPTSAVASPGETLKHVLEVFGATGIKVGQFLLASQILPEHEARILMSLQDQAKVPSRMDIYEDVYDIFGLPEGSALPFRVLELLGAASMKYAFLAQDNENLQRLVIKIFRLDALNNVDMQFDILESMSQYLIEHYGPKYGVLDVILDSARKAVRREQNFRHEIWKSEIARNAIYVRFSEANLHVDAPQEDLVKERMIVAQYAEGVSFNEINERYKPLIAKKILEMERDIYFADQPVVRFDPDRHAGNYRVWIRPEGTDADLVLEPMAKLRPIDFGQVLRMTREQRERVIRLFALAQIISKGGVNEWLVTEIKRVIGMNADDLKTLKSHLKRYVKAANFNPVTIYISLLAAIRASGYKDLDIVYIDFIRGIIQLTQYEPFAADTVSPSRIFEERVLQSIREYLPHIELDRRQIAMIKAFNTYQRARSWLSHQPAKLLSTDLSKIEFDNLIRREDQQELCQQLLTARAAGE